jgi:hypothetical protein
VRDPGSACRPAPSVACADPTTDPTTGPTTGPTASPTG